MKKRHKIDRIDAENENPDLFESSSSGGFSDDDLCKPEGCQETIDTPKFPSPTSCLPEEQQHVLEERIDAANRLLLDLGLSNEEKENGRRILLDGLKGKDIKIKVICSKMGHAGEDGEDHAETPNEIMPLAPKEQIVNKKRKISLKGNQKKRPKTKRLRKKQFNYKRINKKNNDGKNYLGGKVHLVGRNFVELTNTGKKILIPFSRICVILTKRRYEPAVHEQALLDIDPCFRRELTFNFGETVANNPELIQLFFRIQLLKYLESFYGNKFNFYTENGQMQGILMKVDNETMVIEDIAGTPASINADSICYLIKN